MFAGKLLDALLQLSILEGLRGVLALGLEECLMAQGVFDIKQFFGTHFYYLRQSIFAHWQYLLSARAPILLHQIRKKKSPGPLSGAVVSFYGLFCSLSIKKQKKFSPNSLL